MGPFNKIGGKQLILAIALAVVWHPLPTLASESGENAKPAPLSKEADNVCNAILQLVKEYYPKAKITNENNTIHFQEKVKKEDNFSGSHGNKELLAPQSGGIIGDISMRPGEYSGADKSELNCERVNGFHTVLLMAPYSKLQDAHLMARLVFPCDVPFEFKSRFKTIINTFAAAGTEGAPKAVSKAVPEAGSPASGTIAPAATNTSEAEASSLLEVLSKSPASDASKK
jgi:hypothetical protein